MFSERTQLRLGDIVENADRIALYVAGLDVDRYATDLKTTDAVERCLSRITEAVIQIGETDALAADLGIAWSELRALGNRLRHEYRRIDPRLIFHSAVTDVPALRDAAAQALGL